MIRILLIGLALSLDGCGSDDPEYVKTPKTYGEYPAPGPGGGSSGGSTGGGTGGGSAGEIQFSQIKPILDEQCASCHPQAALKDKQSLLAFGALRRIESDSMPLRSGVNYALYNQQKKGLLVAYLRQPGN